jgi:beta-N-acetylhexosaminidase
MGGHRAGQRRSRKHGPRQHGAADGAAPDPAALAAILAEARGRPLVLAVRDARRAAALIGRVLATRPETVIVEMGVPAWTPPTGTAYLATYGASRVCA